MWDLATASSAWPPNRNFTDHEIQTCWLQLAYGDDSSRGNEGNAERANALIEGDDQMVAFLENALPAKNLNERDRLWARELVTPLADPDPIIRTRTARELEKFGDKAWMAFKDMKITDEPVSAVERKILEAVLARGMRGRRDYAVNKVLRQIATPRAKQLLRKLSDELDESPENKRR